jgi:hypothetical protein
VLPKLVVLCRCFLEDVTVMRLQQVASMGNKGVSKLKKIEVFSLVMIRE